MNPITAELAARATSLLLQIAEGAGQRAEQAYDELLYRFLFVTVKTRAQALARQAAFLTKSELQLPRVSEGDMDVVAHDVTVAALQRARAGAARFDPARADGATWALNAAALAYVDVVRAWSGVRRAATAVPAEPETIEELVGLRQQAHDPAYIVEIRAAIDAALSSLGDDERYALLAHLHLGLSYAEIALYRFGDSRATKRVDRAMQSARRKLGDAAAQWRNGSDAA